MTRPVWIRDGSSIISHVLPENTLTADNNRPETLWYTNERTSRLKPYHASPSNVNVAYAIATIIIECLNPEYAFPSPIAPPTSPEQNPWINVA